jgi:hypothetical protein
MIFSVKNIEFSEFLGAKHVKTAFFMISLKKQCFLLK